MWLLEQCRKEWEKAGRDYSYPAIVKMAERATPFRCFVNPDDPRFANPPSMTEAVRGPIAARRGSRSLRKMTSLSVSFESLAFRYKEVPGVIIRNSSFPDP